MNDCYKKIADHKSKRDDMANKLAQVKNTEKYNKNGIMVGSILTIHVVEARELMPMDADGTSDPYVVATIED